MFLTSFISKKGEEITDPVKIRNNYIFDNSFMFSADLITICGGPVFHTLIPHLEAVSICKIIRIRRLDRFLMTMNVNKDKKLLLSIIKNFIYILLILHINACLWYTFVGPNSILINEKLNRWIPMTNGLNGDSWIYTGNKSIDHIYWFFLYTSLMFIGIGEIAPVGLVGLSASILILSLSIFSSTFILGKLTLLMDTM